MVWMREANTQAVWPWLRLAPIYCCRLMAHSMWGLYRVPNGTSLNGPGRQWLIRSAEAMNPTRSGKRSTVRGSMPWMWLFRSDLERFRAN